MVSQRLAPEGEEVSQSLTSNIFGRGSPAASTAIFSNLHSTTVG